MKSDDPDRFFRPGQISRDGFLGTDRRAVREIVREDGETLKRIGLSTEAVADILQSLIDAAKQGLEGPVDAGDWIVRLDWARGLVPCPFGERRLQPKITLEAVRKGSGETILFSQLSVHLIREHGFFGGAGSVFRIEPESAAAWIRGI
ncbi:hypothetical protein JW777_08750 [bacterium]|nr:hypothetical protein [bacterium]